MTRYGMLINTRKCIGCYACRTACQRQNGLAADIDYIRYEEKETGKLPVVGIETARTRRVPRCAPPVRRTSKRAASCALTKAAASAASTA